MAHNDRTGDEIMNCAALRMKQYRDELAREPDELKLVGPFEPFRLKAYEPGLPTQRIVRVVLVVRDRT